MPSVPFNRRNERLRTAARRIAIRFRRDKTGAVAVEFGFVGLPFLILLLALIETGLMLSTANVMDESVRQAARLVLTGQVQQPGWGAATPAPGGPPPAPATNGNKISKFRDEVCKIAGPLIDCTKLKLDIRTVASFSGADVSVPITNGAVNCAGFGFTPGQPREIVVVRVLYEYPLYATIMLANLSGNKRLLVASAAFRNEPFAPTAMPGDTPPPAATCPT